MSTPTKTDGGPQKPDTPDYDTKRSERGHVVRAIRQALSFRNVSAIYVFVLLFVIFSVWTPDSFLTGTTWKTLLDEQAVTAIVALGLVVPLAAGAYDLSIGATVGLGSMAVGWLMSKGGFSPIEAVCAGIVGGLVVGLVNGILVVKARIDAFIATLAVGSVLTGLVTAMSGGNQIIGLDPSVQRLAVSEFLGITFPVYYVLILGLVIWYVLEHTPVGRNIYATGGNPDAARLAGVSTNRLVVVSLVVSGGTAAFAGTLLTARLASATPSVGPEYLLPAFAAAFLGSTQLRGGRFNAWGTIIAVYVLAVGVKGLQLVGAPFWIPPVFNGLALLVAVGLSRRRQRTRRWSWPRRGVVGKLTK